jgi:hypothetical protein
MLNLDLVAKEAFSKVERVPGSPLRQSEYDRSTKNKNWNTNWLGEIIT